MRRDKGENYATGFLKGEVVSYAMRKYTKGTQPQGHTEPEKSRRGRKCQDFKKHPNKHSIAVTQQKPM